MVLIRDWKNVNGRDQFEDLGVDGRIKLKLVIRNSVGGVDWFNVA